MYDLHLHSFYSDGDASLAELVSAVAERKLTGFALTDHNVLGGGRAARQEAAKHRLRFIEGIEISARYHGVDVHVLGYSLNWRREVLQTGLASTRRGYEARVAAMVQKCQDEGYAKVSWSDIMARKAALGDAWPHSYDVARELTDKHGLSLPEAHRMTVTGGACYVPYGEWALSPADVIELIHEAGGVAVLAHPGIMYHEAGEATGRAVVRASLPAGLDGLEVYHPFHSPAMIDELVQATMRHGLLITGGSDWHGESRFPESQKQFGQIGIGEAAWTALHQRLETKR